MTVTSLIYLVAALVWMMLSMSTDRTSAHWKKPEYLLSLAMFGFGGIGMLLALISGVDSDFLLILRFGPLIAISVLVAITNLLTGGVIRSSGLLLTGIFIPMFAFAIVERAYIMPLMSLAVLASAIVVPRDGYSTEPLYTGLRDAVRITLGALSVCIALAPSQLIGQCRGDKCSIWGLAIGPMGTGNALGIYLAFVAGVSVLLAKSAKTAVLTTVVSATLVDGTSSRSAMVAWIVTVVAAHLWRITKASRRRMLLKTFTLATAAFVSITAMFPWRPEEFTGRANLWIVAKEQFLAHPFFGYGPSFWVRQDRTSYVDSNYATHNLFWELLVTGGALGACLTLLALLLLMRRSHPSLQLSTLALITGWMATSTLEVTAAPGRLYLLPGVLLLIFIHGQSRLRPVNGMSSHDREKYPPVTANRHKVINSSAI